MEALSRILAVAVGGAAGSALRYLFSGWVQGRAIGFPWGTLAVNVSGCLLIGFLATRFDAAAVDPRLRAAVLIGVLGGYTTFSSFSWETLKLVQSGQFARAMGNVLGSVGLCMIAVYAGCWLARRGAGS
ncbi:MAG: fluoride efflux transporter CrcB [Phycisphaerae bacterium]|nr:fluoride efflux transporter CrcB [Phycisphaerae bacterium]